MSAGLFEPVLPWLHPAAVAAAISILAVMGLQQLAYTGQLALSLVALMRRPVVNTSDSLYWLYSDVVLPMSLIVPVHDDEDSIVESIASLLKLRYPLFEVIVVNDGSTDRSLARLIEAFDLEPADRAFESRLDHRPIRGMYASSNHPRLTVVDKERGGKADALNAGINVSRMPLFASLDTRSILEAESLLRVVYPFIEDPDRVVAAGGMVRVANGCEAENGEVCKVGLPRRWLPRFQVIEYLRAFLMGQLAWSEIKTLTLMAGAFSVFKREPVIDAGGYRHGMVGEDFELVVRLHRRMREQDRDYRVVFVPEPVCWTRVPETLRGYAAQRIRWQRGTMEALASHARMLFNPRYGRVGMLGMGVMAVVDVLGPVAEVLGLVALPLLWAMGALDFGYVLAFLALVLVYGIFISVGSLMLEEMELKRFPSIRDMAILAVTAVAENLGFRQLAALLRVVGTWRYLTSRRGALSPTPAP